MRASKRVGGVDTTAEAAIETFAPLAVEAASHASAAVARSPRLPPRDPMQAALRKRRARSLIVVPLLAGALHRCVNLPESDAFASFGSRDVDVALIVGRQLAMALENIKTFEREQHLTQRFRFLARVTDRLFATLDPNKMLQLLLDELLDGFADYGVAAADGR